MMRGIVGKVVEGKASGSAPQNGKAGRPELSGRPKLYGRKVRLRDLAKDAAAFIGAASPVCGESGVELTYRCIDLLWRPIGCWPVSSSSS